MQNMAHAQDMQFRIQPFAVARARTGDVVPQLDLLAAFGSQKHKWLGASSYTYLSQGYALSYAGPEFYPTSWALISTYAGLEQGPTLAESWRAAAFIGLYGKPVSWTALLETGGTGPWIGSDLRFDVSPQRFWFTASYRRFVGLGARVYLGLVLDRERTFAFWAGYAPWDPEHPSQRKTDQILFGMYALLKSKEQPAAVPGDRPMRAAQTVPEPSAPPPVVIASEPSTPPATLADGKAPPVDPTSMGPAPDPFADEKTETEASGDTPADAPPAPETPQTGLAPFAPPESQGQPVLR